MTREAYTLLLVEVASRICPPLGIISIRDAVEHAAYIIEEATIEANHAPDDFFDPEIDPPPFETCSPAPCLKP